MDMHRNPHLWQSLPAKAEFEFMALDEEIQGLSMWLSPQQSSSDI
jgi:hypothetical protein